MIKGFIFAALSAISYGTLGYFIFSLNTLGMSVQDFNFWRFLFSAISLLPFIPMLINKKEDSWKGFAFALLLGLLFYSVGAYFYCLACPEIGSGLAMVLFFSYPIFVVLITSLLHKTRPNIFTLISCFFILLGCTLIAWQEDMHFNYYGVSLAISASIAYALYVSLSKNVGKPISPIFGTFAVSLANAIFFALFIFMEGKSLVIPTEFQLLSFLFAFSFLGTTAPILLFLKSLKYISPSAASIISVFEPITSMIISYFVLGENVSYIQSIGALLIVISALFVVFFVE